MVHLLPSLLLKGPALRVIFGLAGEGWTATFPDLMDDRMEEAAFRIATFSMFQCAKSRNTLQRHLFSAHKYNAAMTNKPLQVATARTLSVTFSYPASILLEGTHLPTSIL